MTTEADAINRHRVDHSRLTEPLTRPALPRREVRCRRCARWTETADDGATWSHVDDGTAACVHPDHV